MDRPKLFEHIWKVLGIISTKIPYMTYFVVPTVPRGWTKKANLISSTLKLEKYTQVKYWSEKNSENCFGISTSNAIKDHVVI